MKKLRKGVKTVKKKGVILFTLCIISLLTCIAVAYAAVPIYVNYSFRTMGQNVQWIQPFASSGTHRLTTQLVKNGDATLGLSYEKHGLFGIGWSFVGRCNPSVLGKFQVSCSWVNQGTGNRRGTVVLNTNPGGGTISGSASLHL